MREINDNTQQRTELFNQLTQLHQFIVEHFSLDELRTLCFYLHVRYDDIAGEGITAKARELLLLLGRNQSYDSLLHYLEQARPKVFVQTNLNNDPTVLEELYREFSTNSIPEVIVPWSKIKEVCEKISNDALKIVANKFDPELYVHRQEIQTKVDQFLIQEEKQYLALVGDSGMGKSAFLWGLVNELSQRSEFVCLFGNPTYYSGQRSIIGALLREMATALGITSEKALNTIRYALGDPSHKLVFIVDAINEVESMLEMESLLIDFQSYARYLPRLRLIISCRPHFWKRVRARERRTLLTDKDFFKPDDGLEPFLRLEKLKEKEMVAFYEKYRGKYLFRPENFHELAPNVQERIREPLMLWLVAEVCQAKDIREKTDLIMVDVEAIPEYVRKLTQRGDLFPDQGDNVFLEKELAQMFLQDDQCKKAVRWERVVEMSSRSNVEEILERLINSSLLQVDGTNRLSFSFERFYGYYFGLHLREIIHRGHTGDSITC